jgi:hypothetical protein
MNDELTYESDKVLLGLDHGDLLPVGECAAHVRFLCVPGVLPISEEFHSSFKTSNLNSALY